MDHLALIKKIIDENEDLGCRLKSSEITENHLIQKDLGLDSIGLMSLIYDIQDVYPDLDETLMTNWQSLKDLIEEMKKHES
jgi:acyl carrier protein